MLFRSEYIDVASAREDYGVVIDPHTAAIDRDATMALRARGASVDA